MLISRGSGKRTKSSTIQIVIRIEISKKFSIQICSTEGKVKAGTRDPPSAKKFGESALGTFSSHQNILPESAVLVYQVPDLNNGMAKISFGCCCSGHGVVSAVTFIASRGTI